MASAESRIRAPRGDQQYWLSNSQRRSAHISEVWALLAQPSGDPSYRPQFIRIQAQKHLELMILLYSAGAPIREIGVCFDGLLRAWEASQELEPSVYPPEIVHRRRHWKGNLDLYIESFWLVGLALALEIPDAQWQRLLALIGNEGQDAVLDAVIAIRQPGRRIGEKVLFPKPYARLHAALLADADQRPAALNDFVTHWYAELDRKGSKGRPAFYNRPYWYTLGDQNFEGGAYFGRWCVEAVAAAKAFGIDDTICCGHEHYPGDLLRPDRPSTHPPRSEPAQPQSWLRRWIAW